MCTHPCHHRRDRRRVLGGLAGGIGALGLGLAPHSARADAAPTNAAPVTLPPPGPQDTCPVCGMFVARYPEWITTVQFKDGHADHFDGPKDYFKYLFDMKKYALGRTREQISGMGVTEYYGLKLVDARQALYVAGSDVLGPMGHELVPLMTAADARDFMKDHAGKALLTFDEVTPDLLVKLDVGGQI